MLQQFVDQKRTVNFSQFVSADFRITQVKTWVQKRPKSRIACCEWGQLSGAWCENHAQFRLCRVHKQCTCDLDETLKHECVEWKPVTTSVMLPWLVYFKIWNPFPLSRRRYWYMGPCLVGENGNCPSFCKVWLHYKAGFHGTCKGPPRFSRFARYRSEMTLESLTNAVAVSSSPAHAGFVSGHSCKGSAATLTWSFVFFEA